jgi:thiopeptide-type bacteriocin biosynthesis protein
VASRSESGAWLSAYLFHTGELYGPESDDVILGVAEPFVRLCQERGWIDGWFFIRYGDRGFHVRLRLHGDERVLREQVWPALREHVRAHSPAVVMDAYPDPPGSGGQGVTHLIEVEYEPETERYGGPEGIPVAEEFFECSSESAIDLLRKVKRGDRSNRLGKGLMATVVLIHAFRGDRDAAARFASDYGMNYLRALMRDEGRVDGMLGAFESGFEQQAERLIPYVDAAWEALETGDTLSDALDAYRDALVPVRERLRGVFDRGQLGRDGVPYPSWEAAVSGIVASYVHMMNNRLGVTIPEEAYLAYLINRATGAPAPVQA